MPPVRCLYLPKPSSANAPVATSVGSTHYYPSAPCECLVVLIVSHVFLIAVTAHHVPTPSFLSLPFLSGSTTILSSAPLSVSSSFPSFFHKIKPFKNLFSSSSSVILFSSFANASLFSLLCLSKLASLAFFFLLNLALAAVLRIRFASASASDSGAGDEAPVTEEACWWW